MIKSCYLYILENLCKKDSSMIMGKWKPSYIKGVGHYGLEQPSDKIMLQVKSTRSLETWARGVTIEAKIKPLHNMLKQYGMD